VPKDQPSPESPKEVAARIAALKGRRDFPGAHALFLEWARQTLAVRTGWPWKAQGGDLVLAETKKSLAGPVVRTFALVAVSVHQLITGQADLGPQQAEQLGSVLGRLAEQQAPMRLLVVVDPGTKRAVLEKFEGDLGGVEVWTAEELTRLPVTLRN
jgi:hypothetical protein